ncbi:CBS domain-containing protein [Flavobacterium nackdongense]|uniref:CBS domain-containing protein n=1 Tax=Flavobacterium nackdongense TaxID=2547394 RepID=A0A4V1AGQ3_9FLAO|nr:CBS domain-containing protein [Flavobacterium nackdongense]QBN18842.1 CBS domain-containing protein [Flavobacterium nackdongense]
MTEITNYITNDYKAIDSQETIATVQDFFDECSFSHFPVIEEGIYIGSIASDDLETFDSFKKVLDYKYTLEGFFVRENMIWLDVLEVFAKNHSNLVPILNEQNQYLGYYEINDILNFFHETPFLQENGAILVVQKKTLDYAIGEITQIIESNNGRILGLFVSASTSEYTQVTVKINLGVMNEIIQSFRRYNYEIISEHFEDNYINTLKERSDYLDKYLNM